MQHLKSNKDEDENSKLDISTNDGKMVQEINSDIEKQVRSEIKKDDNYLYRIDSIITTCLVDKENNGIVFLSEHTEETES